jgi:lipopolysaccharide export system permease protein
MSILQRYVLRQQLWVFTLTLLSLTGMLVIVGVIGEASKNGLGPEQIRDILPFVVPSLLPFTIPATFLLTVCVVFGRLAGDNEITAIKAAIEGKGKEP